jgi:hypothetical protein
LGHGKIHHHHHLLHFLNPYIIPLHIFHHLKNSQSTTSSRHTSLT